MVDIIAFAAGAEIASEIAGTSAAIAGLSLFEIEQQENCMTRGDDDIFTFNKNREETVSVVSANGDAEDAYNDYKNAGGATSQSGAATQKPVTTLNYALAESGNDYEAVGLLTVPNTTVISAASPLFGFKVLSDFYNIASNFAINLFTASEDECYEDTKVMPAVVDYNGQVYLRRKALDAIKEKYEQIRAILTHEKDPDIFNYYISNGHGELIKMYYEDSVISWAPLSGSPTVFDIVAAVTFNSESNKYVCELIFISPVNALIQHYENGSAVGNPRGLSSYTLNDRTVYWNTYAFFTEDTIEEIKSRFADPRFVNFYEEIEMSTDVARNLAWQTLYGDVISQEDYPDGIDKWHGDSVVDYTAGAIDVVINRNGDTEEYCPAFLSPGIPWITQNEYEYSSPTARSSLNTVTEYTEPSVDTKNWPDDDYSYPGFNLPYTPALTAPIVNPIPIVDSRVNPKVIPTEDADVLEDILTYPEDPVPIGIAPPFTIPTSGGIVPSGGGQQGISAFIHVYNPSDSEIAAFGRWLWVTYSDASIDKIWNNPFDGILGAFELYCDPEVADSKEYIRSGFLISNTLSNLVTKRYVSINCGSVVVPEYYRNYLDYSPYSKAYAYLPFVGIVELNVDDIVGHGVNITYRIDCYNGSCIAQIQVAKENYKNIMYQFSGNCAVDIPLSGGSQAAIKAGLMQADAIGKSSVVGAIASVLGGAMFGAPGLVGGLVGGASTLMQGSAAQVAKSVSQKSSVQHSGVFGSSYGALGLKKPYLIIKRPIQKQVWNYNDSYGFPAHKRVIIGNCSGYLKVKEVNVISPLATNEEKKKIEELLKAGVYVG